MPDPQHILCIDDEEDILAVTTLCLETVGGFQVTAKNSGATGIRAARETAPDLILLDVMMPALDGPATLELIRQDEKLHSIPVIFMTARVQPDDIKHYLSLGAAGVIEKPFDPMSLPQKINDIWRVKR